MKNNINIKRGKLIFDTPVTKIGNYAFNGCSSLTSVTIPNNVTSIGLWAFYNCSSLTSVTIPNSVTSIGYEAFKTCKSLTSVTIPDSVTSIGSDAFGSCSSLTSIVVKAGNTTYDSRENCNAIIQTATNTLIVGCQNTSIPNSVTSIGNYAFYGCSSLISVTIPNSVTSIGSSAFESCSSLTSVTIGNSVTSIKNGPFNFCRSLTSINVDSNNPNYSSVDGVLFNKDKTTLVAYPGGKQGAYTILNSVTSIGWGAFNGCRLTSITIPNSVTSIGSSAFRNCFSLTSITCEAVTPPTLDSSNGISNVTAVYVPAESVEAYKTATNWSYYSNVIQPIPS